MRVVQEVMDLQVDFKGKTRAYLYNLELEGNKVVNVRKQNGFSCDKNSGVWEHFSLKYKDGYYEQN